MRNEGAFLLVSTRQSVTDCETTSKQTLGLHLFTHRSSINPESLHGIRKKRGSKWLTSFRISQFRQAPIRSIIGLSENRRKPREMDDPTIERTSLGHVSHSCADIYAKKPFHFFKLFNLFLPQVYCQLRESGRECAVSAILWYLQTSPRKRSYTFCVKMFSDLSEILLYTVHRSEIYRS